METDNTIERQQQIAAEGLRRHRAIGNSPASVARESVNREAEDATRPRDFGHNLTSAPNGRGGCMTFEEIMRHGGQ